MYVFVVALFLTGFPLLINWENVPRFHRFQNIDTFVTNWCFDGYFQSKMALKAENIIF